MTTTEYLNTPETLNPQELIYGVLRAADAPAPSHQAAVGDLFIALATHVRDEQSGEVWLSPIDLILDEALALVVQPDLLFISNERREIVDDRIRGAPDLVIEVLSATTEATDRREKLLAYRTLASLSEYVLISQDEARVEIHRRRGDIGWEKIEYFGPETVEFASVGLQIGMREIYEGVPIESLARQPGQA